MCQDDSKEEGKDLTCPDLQLCRIYTHLWHYNSFILQHTYMIRWFYSKEVYQHNNKCNAASLFTCLMTGLIKRIFLSSILPFFSRFPFKLFSTCRVVLQWCYLLRVLCYCAGTCVCISFAF